MPESFLTGNLVLDLGISAWFFAQLIKVLFEVALQHRLNWRTMVSSGGMPSSHSAFVCAMAAGIAQQYGLDNPLFALAAGMAAVVMYDACNVRREAGEHAKVLNELLDHLNQMTPEGALKVLLGHTPLQVFMGALLGCAVGLLGPLLLQ